MERIKKINQAYIQKPWRIQLQRLGLFLAVLVFCGLIAGVYLSVNAKAATVGRQIQFAHAEIRKLENEIVDQQALLAELTSTSQMEQRALEMGFRRATSGEIIYLKVDGYSGRTPVVLASETKNFVPATNPNLSPEFNQSLFDWIIEKVSLPLFWFENSQP
jgi:hypothetical protein